MFLAVNGAEIPVPDDEYERLTMEVARGELGVEALTIWFRQRTVRRD